MTIDESRKGVFQAGNRIPADPGAPEGPTVDVGVRMECLVRPSGGQVDLQGSIEISSADGMLNAGRTAERIIGQRKLEFHKSMEQGKPAVIAEAGTYQVEATVTRQ